MLDRVMVGGFLHVMVDGFRFRLVMMMVMMGGRRGGGLGGKDWRCKERRTGGNGNSERCVLLHDGTLSPW